ncbi:hypothetical protein S40288_09965 [Stachybotrys chartarum IBT 40288]|nr:hypothetical protein S40288_09965 [Stachybotrys chartarum IBT 40288]
MEPVGLAVGIAGLAGLFSSCLEAIERVKDYRSFETDSQTLNAHFEADRLRFKRWGHSVGLELGQLLADHHELLDDERTVIIITGLLKFINDILHRTSPQEGRGKAKPSSSRALGSHDAHSVVGGLRRRKLSWALGGKEEHSLHVELFRRSIQQLHNLVPPDRVKDNKFLFHRENTEPLDISHGIL